MAGPILWNDGIFWGTHRLTQGSLRTHGGETHMQAPREPLPEADIPRDDYIRYMGSAGLDPLPEPDISREDYMKYMG